LHSVTGVQTVLFRSDRVLLPLDETPDKSTSATGLLIGAIAAAVVAAGVVWWWLAR